MADRCKNLVNNAKAVTNDDPSSAVGLYQRAASCYSNEGKEKEAKSCLEKAASKLTNIAKKEQDPVKASQMYADASEIFKQLGREGDSQRMISDAGGSFVTLDDFGTLQYGSDKLNARADATLVNSPGSFGFDDDGVPAQNTNLIDKGILVGAIT